MGKYRNFSVRTDMAHEAHRLWQGSAGERTKLNGVRSATTQIHGLELIETQILDAEGEQALGKARGKYFSLSLPRLFDRGAAEFADCAGALSELIRRCAEAEFQSVLIAALGNPDITPDALGNLAAGNILVTRHLDREAFPQFKSVALCRPGVLGTSGMESAEQIKQLCELVRPSLVIAIDALAGSDGDRLCRSIQLSDAGINPGSGVGNNRQELSRAVLGVPVLAIGMPTVIDAGHFGGEGFDGMFVTPRNIDSVVRAAGRLIGYGINMAVHGLSVEEIDGLI